MKKTQLRLEIDTDIINRCAELAEFHNRTLSAQINALLRLVLDSSNSENPGIVQGGNHESNR